MTDNNRGCSSENVELNVEKTEKGVKIEVAPKGSCSSTKDAKATATEDKKSGSCGCC